jgi:hypothetical protein
LEARVVLVEHEGDPIALVLLEAVLAGADFISSDGKLDEFEIAVGVRGHRADLASAGIECNHSHVGHDRAATVRNCSMNAGIQIVGSR